MVTGIFNSTADQSLLCPSVSGPERRLMAFTSKFFICPGVAGGSGSTSGRDSMHCILFLRSVCKGEDELRVSFIPFS